MNPSTQAESQGRPGLMTIPEAGHRIAGWTKTNSYEAARTGRFPVPLVRIGGRVYVRAADIDAFISGQPHASTMHAAETA